MNTKSTSFPAHKLNHLAVRRFGRLILGALLAVSAASALAQSCEYQIFCPPSIVTNICGAISVPVFYQASATNICNQGVSILYSTPPGSSFGPGTHPVVCSARFSDGHVESCAFTINVTTNCPPPPPTNCPIAHCSTNLVRYLSCGSNCVPVYYSTWGENPCNPTNVVVTTSPLSGSCFTLGNHTVDVWASAGGQTDHCSFMVTVLSDPNCPPPANGCTNCSSGCSTNLLVNGSFESPGVPDGYVPLPGGNSVIAGWTTLLNGVEYYNPVAAPIAVNTGTAADGNFLLDLAPTVAGGGGIQQTFGVVPGKSYRVSFMMGTSRERGRNGMASLSVIVGGMARAFNLSTESANISWERKEFSFVAPPLATTATLVFSTMDDPALSFVNLDDVRVSDCCRDPGLRIKPTITVEWSCGILQSAPDVYGPYLDVPGATSPYTTEAAGPRRFFRTR